MIVLGSCLIGVYQRLRLLVETGESIDCLISLEPYHSTNQINITSEATTILVTGATGRTGSEVVKALIAQGVLATREGGVLSLTKG